MIRSLCATALLVAGQVSGLKSVTDGCRQDGNANVVDACLMESDNAAVRCCDDSGATCASLCPDALKPLYNYTEAMGLCEEAGRRLCTREELEEEVCCDTGCSYDNHQTWVMDAECDEMDDRECAYDGNLEVLLPPLLDEDETRVILTQVSSDMQVRLLVPKQYENLKVDFEGATDPAGALDSADPDTMAYWGFDFESDPCNIIVTGTIPWDLFRDSLGGVTETRFTNSVSFGTVLSIETTLELELAPETLLAQGQELLQSQTHIRLVRTRIPFEITFDLDVKLWAEMDVRSDHLRVASAVVESSVLTVTPDELPLAKARLEFVTIIPHPLILERADIRVNDDDLSDDLSIEEVESKRECNEPEAFCKQYWLVWVNPNKCDLNGEYTATVYGVCHPDATNCLNPSPNTTDIVMDITSDEYCGISQKVELVGSMNLQATECNDNLKGSIIAASPQDARIEKVEIVELIASPTLVNPDYLTIFNAQDSIEILNYRASSPQNESNRVDFEFEWRGSELRCDVVADVDALIRVEFEATAPLLLSSGSSNRFSHKALLDDSDIRMVESVRINAAPTSISPTSESVVDHKVGGSSESTSSSMRISGFLPLALGVAAGMALSANI